MARPFSDPAGPDGYNSTAASRKNPQLSGYKALFVSEAIELQLPLSGAPQ